MVVINLCLLFSLFFTFSNSFNLNRYKREFIKEDISDAEAYAYLKKFGYFEDVSSTEKLQNERNPISTISNDDTNTAAILKFQKYMSIEETGKFDQRTKRKMAEPRCGDIDFDKNPIGPDSIPWTKAITVYSLLGPFSSDVPLSALRPVFQDAFPIWSKHIPKDFVETVEIIADGRTFSNQLAAIKIGFWKRSHYDNVTFDGYGGIVAHTSFKGILHYDIEEKWHVYSENETKINGTMDFFTVTLHEIGHILGLPHSNNSESIMFPYFKNSFDKNQRYRIPELSIYDIQNIQRLYGKRENATLLDEICTTFSGGQCVQGGTVPPANYRFKSREVKYMVIHSPLSVLDMLISKAFSTWSEYIPLDFYQTSDINLSEIRFRFVKAEHFDGIPFNKIAPGHYIQFSEDGSWEIHYNMDTRWVQNNVGEKINTTGYDFYQFTLSLISGVLGVISASNKDSIKYWNLKSFVDENGNYIEPRLSQSDIEEAQKYYGVR